MAVKLISIKRHKDGEMISAWLDEENAYVSYAVNKTGATRVQEFSKKNYKSYDHFANVLGKFKPDVLFLASPVKVENYTFEALNATFEYLALEGIVERDKVKKFNPHHDEKGRFAEAPVGGHGGVTHHQARHIQMRAPREKPDEMLEVIPSSVEEEEAMVRAWHGTVEGEVIQSILREGLKPQESHNWDPQYYTGDRKGKVFVATGQNALDVASVYANEASVMRKESPIIIEAHIPKSFFDKEAIADEKTTTEAWKLPFVRPEWIRKVYPVIDIFQVGKPKNIEDYKKSKADKEDTVVVYVPMSQEVLDKVLEVEKKKREEKK